MLKTIPSEKLNQLILSKARQLFKTQQQWRRHLHQYPELSTLEFNTTAFLKKELQKRKLKLLPLKMPTGLLAEQKGSAPGVKVAVRTDIDALPIFEQTKVPFRSKIDGCMHACGHDLHMAVVLGVACLLKDLKEYYRGSARFIFQPAEEMPPGGARPMIENGALKDIKMIFGLHNDPLLQVGKIGLRDGVTMAAVLDFDLIIHGTGGHAARPQNAVDAIVTASEIIQSLQTIIAREIDPIAPAVITFGKIEGGQARNVIADRVTLTGTARTLSPKIAKEFPKLIKKTASAICKARGAKLEMNLIADYPVLSNSVETNKIIAETYTGLFGKNSITETDPVLGGEDFACYLEKTKGAMFRLGAMNKKIKADQSWHSPLFKVDEEAIYYGTALLTAAVINYLNQH